MAYLINTIEGRLQLRLGTLMFENEALRQSVEELEQKLRDIETPAKKWGKTKDTA